MQTDSSPQAAASDDPPRLAIGLGCIATIIAVGNVAYYPLLKTESRFGFIFIAIWFGVFVGQAGLGAIWLALGNANELFRLATAGGAYAAVAAMCFAGFFGWEGPNGIQSANWSELASSLLVLPMYLMAAAAPLWLLRILAGWCIHHPSSPPTRLSIRQFSISSLILLTTIVALMLGLGQQAARLDANEPLDFWMSMVGVFLVAMVASATTLVPAAVLLTRFPALSGIVVVVLAIVYLVVASTFAALLTAIGKKALPTEELA